MSLTSSSRSAGVNDLTTSRNPIDANETGAKESTATPPAVKRCAGPAAEFPFQAGSGVGGFADGPGAAGSTIQHWNTPVSNPNRMQPNSAHRTPAAQPNRSTSAPPSR